MKNIILTIILLNIYLITEIKAQQIPADSYNNQIISEDFNSQSEYFKTITTKENYFIIDNGDYLMSRNNKESEFAVIANSNTKINILSDFILKTSVRIGPSKNKKASLGIILKAQQNGKGAVIFEINRKNEYRIKKLKNSSYEYLSGKSKNNGWVKSKLINDVDEHTVIEIRVEKNIYDIYLSGEYLTTFFVSDYDSGSCGLIISSETKARISHFYIYIKGNKENIADFKNNNITSINQTIEDLNKKIKILEENNSQLVNLNASNEDANNKKIENLEKTNIELEIIVQKHKEDIKDLNELIKNLKNEQLEFEKTKESNIQSKKIIEELQSKNNTLTNSNNKIKEEKQELTLTNINLEKDNNQKQNKIQKLTNENKNLDSYNKTSNKEIENIKLKNTELASITTAQKKELVVLENKNSKLNTNLDGKSRELKKIQQELIVLKNELDIQKSVNEKLKINESQNISLNSKIDELKLKLKTINNSNNKLITDLKNKNEKQKENKLTLLNSLNTKSQEIKELNTKINKLNFQVKNINKVNSNLETCNNNVKTLEKQLQNIKNEVLVLKDSNEDHNKLAAKLKNEIKDVNQNIFSMNNQIVELTKSNKILKDTNTELKELFIQKDFELNGIIPDKIIQKTIDTSNEESINNTFTVQIGVFMQEVKSKFSTLKEVWFKSTENGTYIYYSGKFYSRKEAVNHMNYLTNNGFNNLFIVTLEK